MAEPSVSTRALLSLSSSFTHKRPSHEKAGLWFSRKPVLRSHKNPSRLYEWNILALRALQSVPPSYCEVTRRFRPHNVLRTLSQFSPRSKLGYYGVLHACHTRRNLLRSEAGSMHGIAADNVTWGRSDGNAPINFVSSAPRATPTTACTDEGQLCLRAMIKRALMTAGDASMDHGE